jgi:hypothetical protein
MRSSLYGLVYFRPQQFRVTTLSSIGGSFMVLGLNTGRFTHPCLNSNTIKFLKDEHTSSLSPRIALTSKENPSNSDKWIGLGLLR